MDTNRKTAFFTLMDVESKKSYSNIALNHHIKLSRPNSQAFVRELTYGVLENKMLLDHIIDQLASSGIEKIKTADLVILRMGIYQLRFMDSVPEYAAVNESVALAKRYAKGREGFINAVLRAYTKNRYSISLPDRTEDEVKYLSIKYSYEPWIVEMWLEQFSVDFVEDLLRAGNATPDTTIRLNWLKVMKEDLIDSLTAKGFEVTEGKLCDNALHVKGSGLLDTAMYKSGLFSVQDEASILVSVMLEPRQGDTVVDVCAAPGGKTLKADRVLVAVPCSGLGVVRKKPEIKYKKRTEEIDLLPRKQLEILSASAEYVKPGGIIIYSTCTINPYENQRVIASFLKKNTKFKKEEAVQLLPNINGTDGFFICKMRKDDI